MSSRDIDPPTFFHEVVLSLGSNLGDRLSELTKAYEALATCSDLRLLADSPIYETEPVDPPSDCKELYYLNGIVIVETQLEVKTFFKTLQTLEKQLGRTRGLAPNKPRLIDIDMITFGALHISLPTLTIPHPRAKYRRFVLQPLADLRPNFIFPGDTQDVTMLLNTLPVRPRVVRYYGYDFTSLQRTEKFGSSIKDDEYELAAFL